VPEAVQRQASADALQFDPRYGGGQDVFDALVRRVDKTDPSYRT
ncbi:MAG: class II aldolase/adducin family protein, partial [Gammaproteobacteria bacterium]